MTIIKYEYWAFDVIWAKNAKDLTKQLNVLGENGWELVGFSELTVNNTAPALQIYMKAPIFKRIK